MGQRLKEAAQTGDIDVLYGLTREDAFVLERVNEVPFVDSPLHIAASAGHIEFAMEMVNMKASFARKLNPDDFSPMHLALQHDKTQMVLWLLYVDEGLVRVKGRGGMTPLHYATEQGKTPILEEFFEACPESIKDVTFQGDTALHTAVKNHQVEAFQLLMGWLQRSVFVDAAFWERELLNWKNKEGNTVLHIAASSNQRQIRLPPCGFLTGTGRAGNLKRKIFCYAWTIRSARLQMNTPTERRNALLVVDALIATITYQAALSPPGGVWTADVNSHLPNFLRADISATNTTLRDTNPLRYVGSSVMGTHSFSLFWFANTAVFLVTIIRMRAGVSRDHLWMLFPRSLLLPRFELWLFACYSFSMSIISRSKA
ncbi:hypothetical protein P3X46_014190 [Hevea brasiliensis]|uniref:PGG domain-containing protein n=1 Tax=Hevea brasiliensis TaxID=3981 RepID=A0ABQ9M705_HEVBR|nr:hypothetical protein P3X46_014190 [Hevea brasiliensis]